MKKRSGYLVFMLALFFLASANSVHAQQVDSEVGITFYQKNYKDQVVPFEKIPQLMKPNNPNRETINSDKGLINQLLPNTGEKPAIGITNYRFTSYKHHPVCSGSKTKERMESR